jgi:predicted N-acyltransferase
MQELIGLRLLLLHLVDGANAYMVRLAVVWYPEQEAEVPFALVQGSPLIVTDPLDLERERHRTKRCTSPKERRTTTTSAGF